MNVRSLFSKKAAVEDPLASLPLPQKAADNNALETECENIVCMERNETVWSIAPRTPKKKPSTNSQIPLNVKPAEVSAEHMCRAFSLERDRWMDSTRVVNTPRSTIPRETLAKPHGIRIKTDYQTTNSVDRSPLATNPTTPTTSARDSGYDGSPAFTQSPTFIKMDRSLTVSHTTGSAAIPKVTHQDSGFQENFLDLSEDNSDEDGLASTFRPATPFIRRPPIPVSPHPATPSTFRPATPSTRRPPIPVSPYPATYHPVAPSILRGATLSRLDATMPCINYPNGKTDKNYDDEINELQGRLRRLRNAEICNFQSVSDEEAESSPPVCDEYHAFLRDSAKNNNVAKPYRLSSELTLDELKAVISEMEEENERNQPPYLEEDQDRDQEPKNDEDDELSEFDLERMNSIIDFYYKSSLDEQVKAGLEEGINKRSSVAMSTISKHDTEAALDLLQDCNHPCCENSTECTLVSRTGAVFEEEPMIPHGLGLLDAPFATLLEHRQTCPDTRLTARSSVQPGGSQKALPALPQNESYASDTFTYGQWFASTRREGSSDVMKEKIGEEV